MGDSLLLWLIVGLVVFAIWRSSRGNWDVHVSVTPETVQFHKGVARIHQAEMTDFFQRIIPPTEAFQVFARQEKSGKLHMKFQGKVPVAVQQQIRNYFINLN